MPIVSRRALLQSGLGLAGLGGLALLTGCDRIPGGLVGRSRVYRVGVLTSATHWLPQLRAGLADRGYVEGQNVQLEVRSAEGRVERLPDLAHELVQLPAEAIVVAGVPAIRAAMTRTRDNGIPVVMVAGGDDPVALGFVASLAQPGGNVTGLTDTAAPLTAKRLELLREAVPSATRVGVLKTPVTTPSQWQDVQAAASQMRLELELLDTSGPDDLERPFAMVAQQRIGALLVLVDAVTVQNQARLGQFALQYAAPAMHSMGAFVSAGGLMAYGPNVGDLARRAATYVDKILQGAKPADLPVEQASAFDFAINLKAAQSLGLTIPQSVLQQATELVQ